MSLEEQGLQDNKVRVVPELQVSIPQTVPELQATKLLEAPEPQDNTDLEEGELQDNTDLVEELEPRGIILPVVMVTEPLVK